MFFDTQAMLASSMHWKIRHLFFKIRNAHTTLTVADDRALLNRISSGSLVPSQKGFWSLEEMKYALSPTIYVQYYELDRQLALPLSALR